MTKPNLHIAAIDPDPALATHSQVERGGRNLEWLAEHWADLLPQARGRFVAVAGNCCIGAKQEGAVHFTSVRMYCDW
jgi:hypothetical protein